MVLTPLTHANPFRPVSRDGPVVSHCRNLETHTPHPTLSLLAAYDACATPEEKEMLLSTIKCGPLQR